MVDILGAVLTDGLDTVGSACAEALSNGIHSAGGVLNILARRREQEALVTITTPVSVPAEYSPFVPK